MMVSFSSPKGPVYIVEFLASVNLACNKNQIYKGAAMSFLLHFVRETFVNAINSRMYTEDMTILSVASVRSQEPKPWELLRTYLIVLSYLLNTIAVDQPIDKNIASIQRNILHSTMTGQQYADKIIAEPI